MPVDRGPFESSFDWSIRRPNWSTAVATIPDLWTSSPTKVSVSIGRLGGEERRRPACGFRPMAEVNMFYESWGSAVSPPPVPLRSRAPRLLLNYPAPGFPSSSGPGARPPPPRKQHTVLTIAILIIVVVARALVSVGALELVSIGFASAQAVKVTSIDHGSPDRRCGPPTFAINLECSGTPGKGIHVQLLLPNANLAAARGIVSVGTTTPGFIVGKSNLPLAVPPGCGRAPVYTLASRGAGIGTVDDTCTLVGHRWSCTGPPPLGLECSRLRSRRRI